MTYHNKPLTYKSCVTVATSYIIDWNREHLIGLYLNAKNHLVHSEIISIGTVTETIIHPREVFKPAIIYSATSIMLLHNHPSGDLRPSRNDRKSTRILKKAGELLLIPLVNHLVFNKRGFYHPIYEPKDTTKNLD